MAGARRRCVATAPRTRRVPALKRASAVPHGRDAPAGDLAPPPCLRRLAPRARRSTRSWAASLLALLLARLGADAAVRARRPPRRRAAAARAALAWIGLVCMGLFSSLFVLTAVRDVGLLLAAGAAALWPGAVAPASLVTPSARAVADRRRRSSRCGASSTRAAPPRVVRVDVPIAGLPAGARRLHDRPDQRRPRRADDQAAVRRGDRRRRQPLDVDLVADHRRPGRRLGARPRRRTSRRSPACARARAPSSSPATTSTTRAPRPGCASCAGSA